MCNACARRTQSRRISSNKLRVRSIFRWGPYPETEGLVVNNEWLDTFVRIAASTLLLVTTALYFSASVNLLVSFGILKAVGIIACITPCFVLLWRAIEIFKIAYIEDYAMGPPDNDQAGNIPVVGNTSTVVGTTV